MALANEVQIARNSFEAPIRRVVGFIRDIATGRRRFFQEHPILTYHRMCEAEMERARIKYPASVYDPFTTNGARNRQLEELALEDVIRTYIAEGRIPRQEQCAIHDDKEIHPRVIVSRAIWLAGQGLTVARSSK